MDEIMNSPKGVKSWTPQREWHHELPKGSEIMNSPKGVKSSVPERVSISCPTCSTRHHSPQLTGNQCYPQFVNKPFNICHTADSYLCTRSVWYDDTRGNVTEMRDMTSYIWSTCDCLHGYIEYVYKWHNYIVACESIVHETGRLDFVLEV